MRKRLWLLALCTALAALAAAGAASAGTTARSQPGPVLVPESVQAPESAFTTGDTNGGPYACTEPDGRHSTYIHCYKPSDIRAAYGVDGIASKGDGQTIVLVDAYGSPTAANDLQVFHDTFFPKEPNPDFEQVFPQGQPDYNNTAHGNGLSGPSAAAGWAGEATLDIEWAYAIAPHAHLVLLAVPPAETLGVQGFPNLFKAIQWAIDKYPAGTVFSQSFGVAEPTFGGAEQEQTAKFDQVYKAGNAKGDTFLASSGDNGTTGTDKQAKESRSYAYPTTGWPASSPYVTAVGGTQLQYGWTWNPTSDTPFNADGSYNAAYWHYLGGGNSEEVWNESWGPIATGGNKSEIYSRPSYQDSVASVVGSSRGVPDLSWNAAVNGGVLVYSSFFPNVSRVGWHIYGGTSAASPQIAGLVALANEQQREASRQPLGFLNPLLYRVGSGPAFRDIVPVQEGTAQSGNLSNNQLFAYQADGSVALGPVAGNATTSGYDLTTGFGSPQAGAFVAAVRAARDSH